MPRCLFATDLHGDVERYEKLWALLTDDPPAALFLGGDLLPGLPWSTDQPADDFVHSYLLERLAAVRSALGAAYPRIFVILGNDDRKADEPAILAGEQTGLWEYAHMRRLTFGAHAVYGYACVPPSPFLKKDWERYDVSRHVDPGCVAPEEGFRTVPVEEHVVRHATIDDDLQALAGTADLARAIMLFHAPPYATALDRAALDGRMIDHVPLDVHVGSIAIRRFIEQHQPRLTLHGHVHESARLTGNWSDQIGPTRCLSAAHDGPELAVIHFDPDAPAKATRTLC
ncbi:MAG TPA: metallophosphoesterase [Phycisphaerae bacterium]|nr:metallophosphoesterase [Phycisphaerae bacterium]